MVDVHPLELGPAGSARQAALDGGWHDFPASFFTMGRINEVAIPCVSVEAQRLFRYGYELRPQDHHDLALLDGIQTPKSATDIERADGDPGMQLA